jgi:hypothetical protein
MKFMKSELSSRAKHDRLCRVIFHGRSEPVFAVVNYFYKMPIKRHWVRVREKPFSLP